MSSMEKERLTLPNGTMNWVMSVTMNCSIIPKVPVMPARKMETSKSQYAKKQLPYKGINGEFLQLSIILQAASLPLVNVIGCTAKLKAVSKCPWERVYGPASGHWVRISAKSAGRSVVK